MQYRIVMTQANERVVTDLPNATQTLAKQVEQLASEGWRPQGGLIAVTTPGSKGVFLLQALVHD